MTKKFADNGKCLLMTVVILLITGLAGYFPWWIFVIPLLLLSLVVTLRGWDISSFATGFISGFLTWFGGNAYFEMTLGGDTLHKIALLMSVPRVAVLIIAGLTGGLLAGLAMYTGKCIVLKEKVNL